MEEFDFSCIHVNLEYLLILELRTCSLLVCIFEQSRPLLKLSYQDNMFFCNFTKLL